MDGSIKFKREVNPVQHANLLSKLTFLFALPIFRRGLKDFSEDDVYAVTNQFNSKRLGQKLETEWEVEKTKERPSLFKAIFRVFGIEYLCWGVVSLALNTSMIYVKPTMIGKIVAYFTSNQTKLSKEYALLYSTVLVLSIFLSVLVKRLYSFGVAQIGLKIQIACSNMIYRKILKQNSGCVTHSGGQAVTLISKDTQSMESALFMTMNLCVGVIEMIVMMYLIYLQIGAATFAGIAVIIVFVPVEGFLGIKTTNYKLSTAGKTDERLRLTQEVLSTIRVIKMYTWERFFIKDLDVIRKKEIRALQMVSNLRTICTSLGLLNKNLALYASILTFVAIGNHITAEKAFVVTGCYATVRTTISAFIPISFVRIGELRASLVRMENFLRLEEASNTFIRKINKMESMLVFRNITVSYKNCTVLENISATLKPGITLLTGSIGSGKSSLLKTILGESEANGVIEVSENISYASQDPWLFPGTIRQNIIFNERFNKDRYEMVIGVCALGKDLSSFDLGDNTIVVDKGMNLSKGQKARINLARAIYKPASVYLLDDCLSAVDLLVGKHIFYECMKKFLHNKICLLASHQYRFLQDVDDILLLNNGVVEFHGSYQELKSANMEKYFQDSGNQNAEMNYIPRELEEKQCNETENAEETTNLLLSNGTKPRSVYQETNEQGFINKRIYQTYFLAGGIKIFMFVILLAIVRQGNESWSDYFVRFWVESEQKLSATKLKYMANSTEYMEAQNSHNVVMYQYSIIIMSLLLFTIFKSVVFFIFSSRASINIHRMIMDKILNSAMVFFDRNLTGNIINRLSRDLSVVDEHLPFAINECSKAILSILGILIVVSSVNPWFLLPSGAFTVILLFGCRMYLSSGRNIRRIEGSTRSPVIGHMQATIDGLTTIRASKAISIVREEFEAHQDVYNSAQYMHLAAMHAFCFCMEVFAAMYIAIVIYWLLLKGDAGAGQVGLAITQSFALTSLLQWCLRQWSEFEINMTSAERVLEYTKVPLENKNGTIVDKEWPKKGQITFKNVNLRYSKDGNVVLNNVSFKIEPKEKIGIVGRTGAGKSSIISTLFRLYPFEGKITVDDIDINATMIEDLRSKITIIPQDPVLFSGSIRTNLDPFNRYSDDVLWRALEEVNIKEKVENLDDVILGDHTDFSAGQKQLICLARAVIQNNPILVLDEATANVDANTDVFIQETIKKIFIDRTIIVVAHRLHNIIDCDKILVMEAGVVKEYDSPNTLLKNPNGAFYAMVKEAGLLI